MSNRKSILYLALAFGASLLGAASLVLAQPRFGNPSPTAGSDTSQRANASADQAMYGSVSGFSAASQALSDAGSTERASGDGARAAANASPSGKRHAGSRSRQRSIAAASAEGTPGATLIKLGGVSIDCLAIRAGTLSSSKGSLPLIVR